MTCYEMCLLLTNVQSRPTTRISHERTLHAQKGTHTLLLPATAPRHLMKRLEQASLLTRVEFCILHPSTS